MNFAERHKKVFASFKKKCYICGEQKNYCNYDQTIIITDI